MKSLRLLFLSNQNFAEGCFLICIFRHAFGVKVSRASAHSINQARSARTVNNRPYDSIFLTPMHYALTLPP